jgi:hypothetical protein
MHKRIWLLTVLAILMFAAAANAQTTQINLTTGTDGLDVQFAGSSAGATVSFLGTCGAVSNCTTGLSSFVPVNSQGVPIGQYSGNFTMWMTGTNPTLSLTGANGASTFGVSTPVGTTVNFSFTMPSSGSVIGGTLVGTISFSALGNASGQTPSLNGTFTTTSVTAGSALATYWGSGTSSATVFTVNTDSLSTVAAIAGTGNSTKASPYSGDVAAPASPAPVPEPASIALFGSGLLALGGTIKRRYFR